jgi:succinate-semialdehyde dehydrogenase/glutarate-semialdehyde dehydrogenase
MSRGDAQGATRPVVGAFGREGSDRRTAEAAGLARAKAIGASRGGPRRTARPGIASIDPATGRTLRTFKPLDPAELELKLQRASAAFRDYRWTPFADRARMMKRVADILDEEKEAFGRLMTGEMGKPIRAAVAEAVKCAWACRYYAEHAESLLADEPVETDASVSFVRYQPLGPVLAIMPWNFPFWQVFRFAAPALMAGNVGLLKHASNVSQCALAIEEIFLRAGFPAGVFQTLLLETDQVRSVLEDERVAAATLTGSERAGSAVGRDAGARIKKTVLELGGSDPFIVMPSADLEEAVTTAVRARTINSGQSCIAAKRFIIADAIADEFELRFVRGMEHLAVGDPMDPATDVGPLATADILETLDAQVQQSLAAGARLLTGGERLDRPGYYYAPTVLADVPADAPAYREELFGPVASLFRVRNVADAIRVANDTTFGLGASAWTTDEAERRHLIDEIEAGLVFVNGMVASDPRLPFGGVKQSGYGRELGIYGLREFVNVKTVWIKTAPGDHRATTE